MKKREMINLQSTYKLRGVTITPLRSRACVLQHKGRSISFKVPSTKELLLFFKTIRQSELPRLEQLRASFEKGDKLSLSEK